MHPVEDLSGCLPLGPVGSPLGVRRRHAPRKKNSDTRARTEREILLQLNERMATDRREIVRLEERNASLEAKVQPFF